MEQTELHEKFTVGKSTLKVFKLDAQRATCRNTPATFCALDYTWAYVAPDRLINWHLFVLSNYSDPKPTLNEELAEEKAEELREKKYEDALAKRSKPLTGR